MRRFFTGPKIVLYCVAAILIAAWYVPELNAERYREPIHSGLEAALDRRVKIGDVRFRLLPLPGFTISDVEIGEDPAIGAEPVAYVHTLRGRPTLSALFGGPLEFASVDLEETSVNLTRAEGSGDNASIRWNFSSLLKPKLLTAFPSVHMTGGRVNFKFGDTKSVFYLLNTDVDLWPPARSETAWTLKIKAEPARTDRPSHGFGSFVARGELQPDKSLVTLDVKLEKSELGDMVTLFRGQESNLHGHIEGSAHLAGPMNRIGIAGTVRIDDIHGWNQTPPGGSAWPVYLGGALDIPGQTLDVRATTQIVRSDAQSPLDVRYRVTNYLSRPVWGVTAMFSHLPVSPMLDIGRNMGLAIPDGAKFDGSADGAVSYAMPDNKPRLDGQVRIGASTITFPGAAPLKVADAALGFAGATATLAPVAVSNEAGQIAMVSGAFDMDASRLETNIVTDGMSLVSVRPQLVNAAVPLLSVATSGTWSGALRFASGVERNAANWTGEIHLKDADLAPEMLSTPLHIVLADATLTASGIMTKRLTFSAAGMEGSGEYRYEIGSARPHRFRVNLATVEAAALEKLFAPALRHGSFLSSTLGIGRAQEPDWMRDLHADGSVQIAALNLSGQTLNKLRARLIWDADRVTMSGLQANLQNASLNGSASVSLAAAQPRYDLSGTITGYPLRAGKLEADATLSTAGTGADLLSNLKAEGKFRGRGIDVSPDEVWDRVEGAFEWSSNARAPRLKLDQLVIATAGDTLKGTAETRNDGQLVVRLSDGSKQYQASGALLRGEALKPMPQ
jgi:AsmA protein